MSPFHNKSLQVDCRGQRSLFCINSKVASYFIRAVMLSANISVLENNDMAIFSSNKKQVNVIIEEYSKYAA